jgi:hypothetical protein
VQAPSQIAFVSAERDRQVEPVSLARAIAAALEFPLVRADLRRLARRRLLYFLRVIGPIAGAFFLGWVWASYGSGTAKSERQFAIQYSSIFFSQLLIGVQMFLAFALPVLTASSALNAERHENSFSFLLLAGTSHWELCVTRYLTSLLPALMAIIACVPLYAVPVQLQRVTATGLTEYVLVLFALASLVTALSLFASAIAGTPAGAFRLAVAFTLALFVGLNFIFPEASAVPLLGGPLAAKSPAALAATATMGLKCIAGSAILISLSAVLFFRAQNVQPRSSRTPKWRALRRALARVYRIGPAGMLYESSFAKSSVELGDWFLALFLALVAYQAPLPILLATPLIAAYRVTASLSTSRKLGALDFVLLTPCGTSLMSFEMHRVHMKQTASYTAVLVFSLFMAIVQSALGRSISSVSADTYVFLAIVLVAAPASFALAFCGWQLFVSVAAFNALQRRSAVAQAIEAYLSGWCLIVICASLSAPVGFMAGLMVATIEGGINSNTIEMAGVFSALITVLTLLVMLNAHYRQQFLINMEQKPLRFANDDLSER